MVSSNETLVLNSLTGDAFVLVNKKLLRFFDGDCNAAVFLSELLAIHKYHLNNQSLDLDNSFPAPIKRFQRTIGMTASKQDRIFDLLEKEKLCTLSKKGFPAQKYVSLNFDTLVTLLESDEVQIKKINQQEFYQNINTALNIDPTSYAQNRENLDTSCDNMNYFLKGTLILLSQGFLKQNMSPVMWDPENLGKVRAWVGRRSFGKPFDFSIIVKAVDLYCTESPVESFKKFILRFLDLVKSVPDAHFSQQVYDYTELLEEKE